MTVTATIRRVRQTRRVQSGCLLMAMLPFAGSPAPYSSAPPATVIPSQAPGPAIPQQQASPTRPTQPRPPLALPDRTLPDAYIDLPFHDSVAATGGSGRYSILVTGQVPSGLTVQQGSNTVAIGGTPTAAGSFVLTVGVTDLEGGSVAHDYTITVHGKLAHPEVQMAPPITDNEGFSFGDADNSFFPLVLGDPEGFKFGDAYDVFMPVRIVDNETFSFSDTDRVATAVEINDSETFQFSDAEAPTALTAVVVQDAETFYFSDSDAPVVQQLPGQTITFPALPSPLTVGSSYTLYATSSSGLPVSYATNGFAGVNGNILSVYGAGQIIVEASQAGNSSFAPATTVSQTLNAVSGTVVQAAPVMQIVPGQLSTLAGQGSRLCEGCLATTTEVGSPADIVVDSAGNVYFTDAGTQTVQKITASTGIITNIAGEAEGGGEDVVKAQLLHRTAAQRAAHRANPAAANAALLAALKGTGTGPMVRPQPHEQGTAFNLGNPEGIAVDASGDVFFVDSRTSVVYKLLPSGTITIVAGTYNNDGYSGDGGPATSAQLEFPIGLALDTAGDLYIADSGNAIIRKVDTSGNISTVAGTPNHYGNTGDNGAATSATFSYPTGVTVDPFGNIFVVDNDFCVVRKINPAGTISTIAGGTNTDCEGYGGDGGPASAAVFYEPFLIHSDAAGSLYIDDATAVRKIDSSGIIRDVAGTEVMEYNSDTDPTGPATTALIGYLGGASTDNAGNLYMGLEDLAYVAEAGPSAAIPFGTVQIGVGASQPVTLSNSGTAPLTFSGTPTVTGAGFAIQPQSPYGCNFSASLAPGASCDLLVTFNPTSGGSVTGSVSFADNATNSPQTIALSGAAVNPTPNISLTPSPASIIVGNTLTLTAVVGAVTTNGPIPTGTVQLYNNEAPVASQTLNSTGTAVFSDSSLPVGQYGFAIVYSGDSNYASATSPTVNVGVYPATAGGYAPTGTLQIVPGVLSTLAGQGSVYCEGCPATTTLVNEPQDVVVDNAGNIYFTDNGTGTVQMITASTGIITNIAGINTDIGGGDAQPRILHHTVHRTAQDRAAHRANPAAVNAAAQAAIQAAHTRALAAPRPHTAGTSVSLENPLGIAVDGSGDVFFSDADADVVYEVTPNGNIAIVAGTYQDGGYSGDGGPATSAQLSDPTGVALDAAGNLYIADSQNALIRKVDTSGNISTVAGSYGNYGDSGDGGQAISASLSYPVGVTVDPFGNLFLTDDDYCIVRKVNSSGVITTIAGNSEPESECETYTGDGGPAYNAILYDPNFLHSDLAGSLYIADGTAVRKIDTNGIIRDVAGIEQEENNSYDDPTGPAVTADLGYLGGATVDNQGNLYIGLSSYEYVVKAGPTSTVAFGSQQIASVNAQTLTLSNTGTLPLSFPSAPVLTGSAFSVTPRSPYGCSFPATLAPGASCDLTITFTPAVAGPFTGTLTFTDSAANSQQVVTLTGSGAEPIPTISLNPSLTSLIAGNSLTLSSLVSSTTSGGPIPTGSVQFFSGSTSLGTQTLDSTGLAQLTLSSLPAGSYFFSAVYSGDPNYSSTTASTIYVSVLPATATLALTASPTVVTSGQTINASVTISGNSSTAPTGSINFELGGTVVSTVTITSATVSTTFPATTKGSVVAVYSGDSFYSNASSNAIPITLSTGILQFVPGQATTYAGVPGSDYGSYSGDGGPATSAHFNNPFGIAFDNSGNGYISDQSNNEIRRVGTNGNISNFAGIEHAQNIYSCYYYGNGVNAAQAEFCNPSGIAVDANNNVYVADYGNDIVRRIDAVSHIITTVAGVAQINSYNGDGPGTSHYLSNPIALAFDASGNLYIADYGNNMLRKLDTSGNMTTVAGAYGAYGGSDGQNGVAATSVALTDPTAVAVDAAGNIYVTEAIDNDGLVRKINTSGIISTVAGGQGFVANNGDGLLATQANLSEPYGLAIDAVGTMYISDLGHAIVRRVDPNTHIISTVVGVNGAFQFYVNPAGAPANNIALTEPEGLALDGNGALYAVDSLNQTVIKVGEPGSMLFAQTLPGNTSPGEILTLSNTGNEAITFNATPYTITGNFTAGTASTNPCNFSQPLPIGGSCNLQVQYAPPANTNNLEGTIAFNDNALSSPQTVYLQDNPSPNPSTTTLILYSTPSPVGKEVDLVGSITVSGVPASGTVSFYDGTTFLGTATVSSSIADLPITTLAVGTHSITALYSGDLNYAGSTSTAGTLVITSTVTVTANNVNRAFDQLNNLTYSINGLPNGVNPPGVTGAPSISTTAVGISPLGTYPITITQGTLAGAGDTFTFVNGTLNVNQVAQQTILFSPMPALSPGMTMTLTARATSGLPVTYTVSGPGSINGNKLTVIAAGLVTVTANQYGNGNYAPAPAVSQSFTAP